MTDESIARLRISLADTEPEVWRRVDVLPTASLNMLHDITQAAMGWEDYHLWMFEAEGRRYGLADPEWPDRELTAAKDIKLGALTERGVHQLTYTYDLGDNWEHVITVEAILPGDPDAKYPRFIEGARRCPPEDVGSIPGYENFLEAVANTNHEEHAEILAWYGAPYDPDNIDELITERRVAAIATRRAAGSGQGSVR